MRQTETTPDLSSRRQQTCDDCVTGLVSPWASQRVPAWSLCSRAGRLQPVACMKRGVGKFGRSVCQDVVAAVRAAMDFSAPDVISYSAWRHFSAMATVEACPLLVLGRFFRQTLCRRPSCAICSCLQWHMRVQTVIATQDAGYPAMLLPDPGSVTFFP